MGGAAPTSTGGQWLQWATQSPTDQSAYDGPFTNRQTVTFAGATDLANGISEATNLNAISGTATAVATALGWNLYNSSVGGNRIAYGTTTASIGCGSGNNIAFRAGNLTITLS